MKSAFLLFTYATLFSLLLGSCKKSDNNEANGDTTPEFLRTGWILEIASNAARTYDFPQIQAAGQQTVEIRAWQNLGTLGWQSNQQYTASYQATNDRVLITSATGFQEIWDILSIEPTRLLISLNGQQTYIYNCNEPGWPILIKSSVRGCR
jgi:hypothetical protein